MRKTLHALHMHGIAPQEAVVNKLTHTHCLWTELEIMTCGKRETFSLCQSYEYLCLRSSDRKGLLHVHATVCFQACFPKR